MFPPITEADASTRPSRVKRGAIALFRGVRFLQSVAKAVPVVIATAGRDVADAWRESARPNA